MRHNIGKNMKRRRDRKKDLNKEKDQREGESVSF
jgi:hypothetical protein